jgi:hypothetical protein
VIRQRGRCRRSGQLCVVSGGAVVVDKAKERRAVIQSLRLSSCEPTIFSRAILSRAVLLRRGAGRAAVAAYDILRDIGGGWWDIKSRFPSSSGWCCCSVAASEILVHVQVECCEVR